MGSALGCTTEKACEPVIDLLQRRFEVKNESENRKETNENYKSDQVADYMMAISPKVLKLAIDAA
jgi:hypothetical protein